MCQDHMFDETVFAFITGQILECVMGHKNYRPCCTAAAVASGLIGTPSEGVASSTKTRRSIHIVADQSYLLLYKNISKRCQSRRAPFESML